MGKSTISMAIFNSYVCLPEGIPSFPHGTYRNPMGSPTAPPQHTCHVTLAKVEVVDTVSSVSNIAFIDKDPGGVVFFPGL